MGLVEWPAFVPSKDQHPEEPLDERIVRAAMKAWGRKATAHDPASRYFESADDVLERRGIKWRENRALYVRYVGELCKRMHR